MAPESEAKSAPANYTVLARRYRPLTFAELVGQNAVSRALTNALQSDRVAHAYLFTGARGVGKTSTARILAKSLNCVNGPTATPCGVCAACVGIAAGEDIDVLEIDAASNTGVDNIRELRSNVGSRPARSRYKIYIIDEVHMLSKGAFNALLKTLEEPPPHVKFIFATTEVEKIPITILSRCQRFDFPGISLEQIVARLREIVAGEGMAADDEALEMIARRAGGSMRDAQSLLDQLLAFGTERLTAASVHRLLGTADDDRIAEFAAAILAASPGKALELLDTAIAGGAQVGELVDQLIAYWRDLMVTQVAGESARDLSVPTRHREALKTQANEVSADAVLAGLDVLSTARMRFRSSTHGRTLVEMAVVRLSRLPGLLSVGQLTQLLQQGSAPSTQGAAAAKPQAAAPPETLKKKSLTPAKVTDVELTASNLPAVWAETLASMGTILAQQLEKAGRPAIFAPNTLVLRFPAVYNQAREFCQKPEMLALVQDAVRRKAGSSWSIRLEALTSEVAAGVAAPAVPSPVRARRPDKDDAEKVPLVKRMVDKLGAQVMQMDEGFGGLVEGGS